MNKYEFREKVIKEVPVFDTHTHLGLEPLAAEDFWEIGHYFWFLRELKAAGYPENTEELKEEKRRKEFLKAFKLTRNTSMNWVVNQIFKNLYNIEITDEESIIKANKLIKESFQKKEWPREVTDRLGIKKIVTNYEDSDFKELSDKEVIIPRIGNSIKGWIENILKADEQRKKGEEIAEKIQGLIQKVENNNYPGLMASIPVMNEKTYKTGKDLSKSNNTKGEITAFVFHNLCQAIEKRDLFFQLFIGMESGWSSISTSNNEPQRIVKLHGLFDKYDLNFELVLASEINNMDVVQAARMFPNVYVGGLWWFNFRVSSFRECMQKRFEALPSIKSSFIVSDARCIEWCYGKILLIKSIMADFLYKQIEEGWIEEEGALRTARRWLYESARSNYIK